MKLPDGSEFGRRSAAKLTVLASVIGIAAAWSQSVRAQVRAAGVGELTKEDTERDEKLRKAMKALLLEPDSRHDRGWQLARDSGPALAPLLWDMQAAERANQDRRALLASAAILAGAAESDGPALAAVGDGQPAVQMISCLVFAMQPSRGRDQPQAPGNKDWADLYWESVRGRRSEPNEMLTVAALLGSRRFAGAWATPAAADLVKRLQNSPGVIAAAMFAGVPVEAASRPFLSVSKPPRSADLVWRGRLLGSLRDGAVPDDEVVQFAQQVYALTGDAQAGVRSAAALVLSRANRLPPDKERPPWWMLQLLAADPRAAAGLARWIGPVPNALDDREKSMRLAVEYVLGREPRAVVDDRARWGANPLICRHVALALAWRLLGMPKPEPIEVAMPGLPEWFFVQWASGAKVSKSETIRGADDRDDLLARAAVLLQEGCMTRPVAKELLEGTLWRWRSHPGLGLFDAQAALVCDLLLTGSDAGRKYQKAAARLPDRYLPKGYGTDWSVFELGVELWDWLALSEPRLPIPTECLLR